MECDDPNCVIDVEMGRASSSSKTSQAAQKQNKLSGPIPGSPKANKPKVKAIGGALTTDAQRELQLLDSIIDNMQIDVEDKPMIDLSKAPKVVVSPLQTHQQQALQSQQTAPATQPAKKQKTNQGQAKGKKQDGGALELICEEVYADDPAEAILGPEARDAFNGSGGVVIAQDFMVLGGPDFKPEAALSAKRNPWFRDHGGRG